MENAKKAILALNSDSENTITDSQTYELEDASSNEPNAAIFSKDDMTIIGDGKLTVNANYNNGIASNDDLKIQSGNIIVNAKSTKKYLESLKFEWPNIDIDYLYKYFEYLINIGFLKNGGKKDD